MFTPVYKFALSLSSIRHFLLCCFRFPARTLNDAPGHCDSTSPYQKVVGTVGSLSPLEGAVRVGCQPSKAILVRGLADMLLVGINGYIDK